MELEHERISVVILSDLLSINEPLEQMGEMELLTVELLPSLFTTSQQSRCSLALSVWPSMALYPRSCQAWRYVWGCNSA